ncbi:VWA domain-containing protein, partial [Salmonella enterica subsp. enterica serovar 1,4,[5],12:i:-]|nr:VWA domain-containing protein [Salmonella enterica subsp. enterica serovar 1,4,[5],12:i:-]
MKKILRDLSEKDKFSIILFSVKVLAWSPKEKLDLNELNQFNEDEPANVIAKEDYIVPVTKENIEEATKFVDSLSTYGGTNIMGGLRNGLKLARLGKKEMNSDAPHESMLIFLTDGQPNSEESDPAKITANVKEDNKCVTIFSLGFGYDVDMNFLKKL